MIKIVCNYLNGKINDLTIKGHANKDEKGKDIVCAAVSAVSQGGINALENIDNFKISIDDGYLSIICNDKVSENDYHTLRVIMTQLKSIEQSAKQYVKVVEKGK